MQEQREGLCLEQGQEQTPLPEHHRALPAPQHRGGSLFSAPLVSVTSKAWRGSDQRVSQARSQPGQSRAREAPQEQPCAPSPSKQH